MALTPKDREKIVEEETLRFETRTSLHAQHCSRHGGRGRWLWLLAAFALGFAVHGMLSRCCGMGHCPFAYGGSAHHCMMGSGAGPDSMMGSDTAPPASPDGPSKK